MPQFEFPVYALSENKYIVMDASHRLSALMMIEKDFSIHMWVVKGPIESNVLADLTFLTKTTK